MDNQKITPGIFRKKTAFILSSSFASFGAIAIASTIYKSMESDPAESSHEMIEMLSFILTVFLTSYPTIHSYNLIKSIKNTKKQALDKVKSILKDDTRSKKQKTADISALIDDDPEYKNLLKKYASKEFKRNQIKESIEHSIDNLKKVDWTDQESVSKSIEDSMDEYEIKQKERLDIMHSALTLNK